MMNRSGLGNVKIHRSYWVERDEPFLLGRWGDDPYLLGRWGDKPFRLGVCGDEPFLLGG